MTFAQDGTMSQSNPPAGNRRESDSAGHGIWQIAASTGRSARVVGKFVEMKADPNSGAYIGKGVVAFEIEVQGDAFAGHADATQYDADGRPLRSPARTALTATRLRFTN